LLLCIGMLLLIWIYTLTGCLLATLNGSCLIRGLSLNLRVLHRSLMLGCYCRWRLRGSLCCRILSVSLIVLRPILLICSLIIAWVCSLLLLSIIVWLIVSSLRLFLRLLLSHIYTIIMMIWIKWYTFWSRCGCRNWGSSWVWIIRPSCKLHSVISKHGIFG
jgi:hypothetical protein